MYCYHIIFLIGNLLVFVASSDDLLFSSDNPDHSLFDPDPILELDASTTAQQPSIDDLYSSLELMDFDDSVDPTISFEDDPQTLLANTVPQSHCAAAADSADASIFALEARDGSDQLCTTHGPSSSSPNLLSPETLQLFQDPTSGLNNLISPPSKGKNQGGPSGSGEPPNPPPVEPLYPDPDGNSNHQTAAEIKLELEELGREPLKNEFYCNNDAFRKVPVCCDGPVRYPFDILECDTCKILPSNQITRKEESGEKTSTPASTWTLTPVCCFNLLPYLRMFTCHSAAMGARNGADPRAQSSRTIFLQQENQRLLLCICKSKERRSFFFSLSLHLNFFPNPAKKKKGSLRFSSPLLLPASSI